MGSQLEEAQQVDPGYNSGVKYDKTQLKSVQVWMDEDEGGEQ